MSSVAPAGPAADEPEQPPGADGPSASTAPPKTATAPVIEALGLSKRYGENQALDGASLRLKAGEWLGLLGPNGAGKTTLMKAIIGRARPDAGEVRLFGHSANAVQRRRLGVVPQSIAIYDNLTAAENLRAWGRLHGVPADVLDDRVEWGLKLAGLEARRDELTRTYSQGMQRRLNIACGLLHEPDAILLDEPTVGVDPQSRERIAEMLQQLNDSGAALLLTTHQLDEAERLCERIAIIDHGRIVAQGTMNELLRTTVGAENRVRIACDPMPTETALGDGVEVEDHAVVAAVDDLGQDLPRLLEHLQSAGATIVSVHSAHASLQDVFIHLTGRELRE